MTARSIDGPGLAAFTIGSVLIYSGIKGYSTLAVVQNLITGKPITQGVTVTNGLATDNGSPDGSAVGSSGGSTSGTPKSIGKAAAASFGWTGDQWSALEWLWNHESNWNPKAKNPTSGAYGIPQALPYSKMPKMAWPESAGGQSDASTQIQWGLSYIKQRYGNPVIAKAFWQRNSWY